MTAVVPVELGGQTWHMPVSYKASRMIAEQVCDPLAVAMEAYKSGAVNLTTEQVVSILHIGVSLAGCGLPRDEIGEKIIELGMVVAVGTVGEYLGALVSGSPEKAKAADPK